MRYLAWKLKGGGFSGHKLLDDNQIRSIVQELYKNVTNYDIYKTIQEYDKSGKCLKCPIFADFDGLTAKEDALDFCNKIYNELDLTPYIFFSGSKGFHVIVDYPVNGIWCHDIVKRFMAIMGDWLSLDKSVYTNRRLWRFVNSFHTKGQRYKIQLSAEELFVLDMDQIRNLALNPTKTFVIDHSLSNKAKEKMDGFISQIGNDMERQSKATDSRVYDTYSNSWRDNFTPCLKKMLETQPDDGFTNGTILTLTKFFKFYDVSYEECLGLIMSQKHYEERERSEKDVIKVIRSAYNNADFFKPNCKYGSDGIVMRRHCDIVCPYDERPIL